MLSQHYRRQAGESGEGGAERGEEEGEGGWGGGAVKGKGREGGWRDIR